MIYELLYPLRHLTGLGWLNVLRYPSFRAIMSAMTAMLVSFMVAPWFISKLRGKQISQIIREEGPASHHAKRGTPTMGGALILVAVTAGTLLWADLTNRFVWIALTVTLAFGTIGFYDDYLKLVVRDPRGLAARWKYLWQSLAGIAAALALWQTAEAPADTSLYVPFFKSVVVPMSAAAFVAFVQTEPSLKVLTDAGFQRP